jgi:hypothetical protein
MHGAIPPLPQYVFMAWCLGKHRDNFTFTIYLLPLSPDRLWVPPSLLQRVLGALPPGVKRLGRVADQLPPPSAEVKECISTSPIRLHGEVLS